jgi:iodotyrosine deiodinase
VLVCLDLVRKKTRLRELIEAEEKVNYERRMGEKWVEDLKGLSTDWQKEYLTEAPYIIIVFKLQHRIDPETGEKIKVCNRVWRQTGFPVVC